MNVEITLNDDNGFPVLIISNCHQPELVSLKFVNEDCSSIEVSIDDLRMSLKKICCK